jgi:hypothetical protein
MMKSSDLLGKIYYVYGGSRLLTETFVSAILNDCVLPNSDCMTLRDYRNTKGIFFYHSWDRTDLRIISGGNSSRIHSHSMS